MRTSYPGGSRMMVGMRGLRGWLTILVVGLVVGACGSVENPQVTDPSSGAPATPTKAGGSGEARKGAHDPPENPAPDFSVTTFDGNRFSLAEQRGSPVVLNFWESW
jgi:cytochrome oxidase Cu insertion factor (SCO1/SenC/PrrC family)